MSQDCYFFIDPNVPERERKIQCLHVHCRDQHYPDTGWFYRGSEEGYGPWDYKCQECGELIHKAEDDNEDKTETSD